MRYKTSADQVELAHVEIGEKFDLIADRKSYVFHARRPMTEVVYHRWAEQPKPFLPEGLRNKTACGLDINKLEMPQRLSSLLISSPQAVLLRRPSGRNGLGCSAHLW